MLVSRIGASLPLLPAKGAGSPGSKSQAFTGSRKRIRFGRRVIEKMERGSSMLYQVKDLSPEQKRAVEMLLGQPVSEDEAVSIKNLGPSTIIPPELSSEERIEALRALNERFAETPLPDVSEDEEEAAVNEAMRSSRPNYRPIV
jgi:hypothetical protein